MPDSSRSAAVATRRSPVWWLLVVIAGAGVGLAAWAQFWPLSTSFAGEPIDCGSLADRHPDSRTASGFACSVGFDDREMWRLIGGVVAVLAGVLMMSAGFRLRTVQTVRLVDESTTVRAVRANDARSVADTIDDVVVRAMGWRESDPAAMVGSVSRGPASGMLAITETGRDTLIGVISAVPDVGSVGIRVGLWMGPEHRGRGHMRRGVRLVADHFATLGTHVYAETAVGNIAVRTCLERAGFERIGERRVRLPNDSEVDGLIYARFATPARPQVAPDDAPLTGPPKLA